MVAAPARVEVTVEVGLRVLGSVGIVAPTATELALHSGRGAKVPPGTGEVVAPIAEGLATARQHTFKIWTT